MRRVLVANRGEIAGAHRPGVLRRGSGVASSRCPPRIATRWPSLMADRAVVVGPGPAPDSYLSRRPDARGGQDLRLRRPASGLRLPLRAPGSWPRRAPRRASPSSGRPPEVMRRAGDKMARAGRSLGRAASPRAAGATPSPSFAAARSSPGARFPLMLKAAAGGGGRGMAILRKPEELRDALRRRSRAEADAGLRRARVYLERYVEPGPPRRGPDPRRRARRGGPPRRARLLLPAALPEALEEAPAPGLPRRRGRPARRRGAPRDGARVRRRRNGGIPRRRRAGELRSSSR